MLEKTRTKLTSNQTEALMKTFQAKPYLEREEKHQLAKSVNMSERSIAYWFANQRAKSKNDGLLCKSEIYFVKYM